MNLEHKRPTKQDLVLMREEMERKAKNKPNYKQFQPYYDYDRLMQFFAYNDSFKAEFHGGLLLELKDKSGKVIDKYSSFFEEKRIMADSDIIKNENQKKSTSEILGDQMWFVGYAKKKIKENYDAGKYVSINQNEDRNTINTVYYTPELRRMIKETIYAVDIKRCYWNTGIKLGIIPESLAKYAYEKKIRKEAGNVTIGSLGKLITEVVVEKGIIVDVVEKRSVLNRLRLDIIDYIWELACQIYFKYGNIGFFLTDCWFCDKSIVSRVTKHLEKLGFEYSVKPIDVISVLNLKNTVEVKWYDETKENEYKERPEHNYSIQHFSTNNKLFNY